MQEQDPAVQSASNIKETQAGAQTGGAQAGAGSAAQQSGTQTGQAQSGAGAAAQGAGALAQEETVSDVGQGEAYLVNMKRLVENALTADNVGLQVLMGQAQRLSVAALDHDARLRTLAETSLANAVALANRVNNDAGSLSNAQNQESLKSSVRADDNAGTYDKGMDANGIAERERTVRGGDAGDVIRWGHLATQPFFQDLVEAIATKAVAKAQAAAAK